MAKLSIEDPISRANAFSSAWISTFRRTGDRRYQRTRSASKPPSPTIQYASDKGRVRGPASYPAVRNGSGECEVLPRLVAKKLEEPIKRPVKFPKDCVRS